MRENLKTIQQPKVQTGLRIPEKRYEELSALAEDSGISVNTLVLMLIDIGLSAVNLGTQAKRHELIRSLKDTCE